MTDYAKSTVQISDIVEKVTNPETWAGTVLEVIEEDMAEI